MKNGVRSSWSRRSFLKASFFVGLGTSFLYSCKEIGNRIFLKLTGTNHILAHRLRFKDFPKPSENIDISYLIIGAGVTGLSAAYKLKSSGIEDFIVIDLEDEVGGNSRAGENEYSKYPIGAHYLPIPNASNIALLQFLESCGIIIGYDENKQPIFDEEQLCFAPHSRLFIRNYWQDGIVPSYGLAIEEQQEIDRFHQEMLFFTQLKGHDNKFVFDIPLKNSSKVDDYNHLDNISMAEWLQTKGFTSSNLLSYVDYCCRDDFGTGISNTSAFAGIHYFSSRKHDFQKYDDIVLTWPEGNSRLVKHLLKYAEGKTMCEHLVYDLKIEDDAVLVYVYDAVNKVSKCIKATKVISCCPQFVNQYLIPSRKKQTQVFQYAPWLVASIVLKKFPFGDGSTLSWDNVIHQGKGLGYVYNQHQSVAQFKSPFVISYYYSLGEGDLAKRRKELYAASEESWRDFIIDDLSKAHYGIEKEIESIEIFRHGHGMISPVPNFLTSKERIDLAKPIDDRIYFAHSDLSGISIFEEAFSQGVTVVDQILKNIT